MYYRSLVFCAALMLIAAAAVLSGCSHNESTAPATTPIYENLSPEQASDMIQHNTGNTSFVILDVRTSDEYKGGHIKDAVNIDYYSDSFKNELGMISKEKTYLVYCHSGNRSGKTLEIMKELGFHQVYNMTGGIQAWTAKGFPTIQ